MKLEQQVTSLELSKKLRELGVKQESLFVYELQESGQWQIMFAGDTGEVHADVYSAFTVAELGEMLPRRYVSGRIVRPYWCWHTGQEFIEGEKARTEADARAKMLRYLLENKLINN